MLGGCRALIKYGALQRAQHTETILSNETIKRGYKLWVRADNDGYISKLEVYQGKIDKENQRWQEFGLGESWRCVKIFLMLAMKFTLITSSIQCRLWIFVKKTNVSACDTVRANRKGLPALKKRERIRKGGV